MYENKLNEIERKQLMQLFDERSRYVWFCPGLSGIIMGSNLSRFSYSLLKRETKIKETGKLLIT